MGRAAGVSDTFSRLRSHAARNASPRSSSFRWSGTEVASSRFYRLYRRCSSAFCCAFYRAFYWSGKGDFHQTIIDGATMTALPNTRDAIGESWATTGRRARRIARRIARHSRHAAEDIASELRTLISELEGTLGDGTQADAAALRSQVRKRLDDARERLNDTRSVMRERAQVAFNGADEYVHENPWRTIAMVGAVALVAGVLMSRGR
jgi:ElaB/YqjD/DUF883 family membrane-anchored ribosome-binding protein